MKASPNVSMAERQKKKKKRFCRFKRDSPLNSKERRRQGVRKGSCQINVSPCRCCKNVIVRVLWRLCWFAGRAALCRTAVIRSGLLVTPRRWGTHCWAERSGAGRRGEQSRKDGAEMRCCEAAWKCFGQTATTWGRLWELQIKIFFFCKRKQKRVLFAQTD